MKYFRSIISWIDSLAAGNQFRKWVSLLLKIIGVIAFIGAIVIGITILVGSISLRDTWAMEYQTLNIIGSILGLCVNILIGIVLMMLFWHRSNKISALGDESHFTLIPIAVILIRLIGEIGFLLFVVLGIQGIVTAIFGTGIQGRLELLYFEVEISGDYRFITGVIYFVISVLAGAIVLIFHYFLAELINLFVDMATNVKKIETNLSTEETPVDSAEEAESDS